MTSKTITRDPVPGDDNGRWRTDKSDAGKPGSRWVGSSTHILQLDPDAQIDPPIFGTLEKPDDSESKYKTKILSKLLKLAMLAESDGDHHTFSALNILRQAIRQDLHFCLPSVMLSELENEIEIEEGHRGN